MRGDPGPSRAELRAAENDRAVGGMRNPSVSLKHVARAVHFQQAVRPVLLSHIRLTEGLLPYFLRLTAWDSDEHDLGEPAGLTGASLHQLRVKVAQALGVPPPRQQQLGFEAHGAAPRQRPVNKFDC